MIGRAALPGALLGTLLVLLGSCGGDSGAGEVEGEGAGAETAGGVYFEQAVLDFRHHNCATPHKHLLEMNGGAVAVLDHDGDGRLDLFFPQSAALPDGRDADADLRDRMFARRDGAWVDVTAEAACDDGRYTLSAAAPDVDGDGDPDLALCNFGENRLLRNDGGVFTDVSAEWGWEADRWSSVVAFADLDRDGDLDAYVGNYAIYDLAEPMVCGQVDAGPQYRAYCHPDEHEPERDSLWRNDGGRFEEITESAGLLQSYGMALGVLTCDGDDDGDIDLYVANDSTPNFLWTNLGDMKFRDDAPLVGFAVNGKGLSEACMGIDAADVDHDGDWDVVVTNLAMQTNTLYRNDDGLFEDRSYESGIGEPSTLWVGFGARFLDVDHDSHEDLFVVNGHVVDNIELLKPAQSFRQPAQFFHGDGRGGFRLAAPAQVGAYFAQQNVGRALALWDPDDDGDLDAVVVDNDGPAHLLEHRGPRAGNWIGFELRGAAANTQALGARVRVGVGDRVFLRELRGGSSYNAWPDLRLHFGLGPAEQVDWVEVRWPRGEVQRLGSFAAGQYHRLDEAAR